MGFGEPKDRDGKCNARLTIGDNFGDNHATMVCQLEPGHEGPHQEVYESHEAGTVTVTWEKDERKFCSFCGKNLGLDGDWDYVDGPGGSDLIACEDCVEKRKEDSDG
jgi:hypothetical protein